MKLREIMRHGWYHGIDDAGGGGELPETPVAPEAPEGAAPVEAAAPSNVNPDESQFVTRADFMAGLQMLAEQLRPQPEPQAQPEEPEAIELPDPYDDPQGFYQTVQARAEAAAEAKAEARMVAMRREMEQNFAPIHQQQALSALGGEHAKEFLEGLTPQQQLIIAQNPDSGLAKAIREAAAFRAANQPKPVVAPRSEGQQIWNEAQIPSQLQREIDAAYPAIASQFPGTTKAEYTKMVLAKQGRAQGAFN